MNRNYKILVFAFFFVISLIYSQEKNLTILFKDSIFLHKEQLNETEIDHLIDSIQKKFYLNGYFDFKKEILVLNDTLKKIQIIANKKVDSIRFRDPKSTLQRIIYNKVLKPNTKNEFVVPVANYPNFMQSLVKEYSNNGFPFVSIKAEDITIKDHVVFLTLHILKHKKRKIDKFVVKGYTNFPNKFLKNYLRSHQKSNYSDVNLKKISTYFKTLPFVSQIKNPEVLFKKDSTLIYIYLKKTKTNAFDGLIGFDTNEQNNKLQVNGYLTLKLQNIFDKGNSYNINWNNNGTGTSNLNLQYTAPFVFSSPVSNEFHFQLFKKDSTNVNLNIKEVLSLLYRSNHSFLTSFTYESSNSTLKVLNPDIQNYTKYFIGVGYRFTVPAKTGYESKLLAFTAVFNYGQRDSAEKQTILQAQGLYNLQLAPKLYLKTQISYKALKTDVLLLNELFQIGGNKTLRGFKDSSILVNKYAILNMDLKKYINPDSFVKVSSDYGVLQNSIISSVQDKIFSIGLGYGFKISNSGFLSINYMLSKQNGNPIEKGLLAINLETFF